MFHSSGEYGDCTWSSAFGSFGSITWITMFPFPLLVTLLEDDLVTAGAVSVAVVEADVDHHQRAGGGVERPSRWDRGRSS